MHITDLCNSKCSFCVVGSPLVNRDTVRYADLLVFLVENSGHGYEWLNLHGGEPTTHPRLLELLLAARVLGYPEVHIQTNGRRLKDEEVVVALKAHGVSMFVVSLHGADAVTQDCLAQVEGGFEETLAGIRNAKRHGVFVRTNTVLTKDNRSEVGAICRLCTELGVEHVNLSNLHPVGSGYFALDAMGLDVAETREAVQEAIDALADTPTRLTLEGFPLCVIEPYDDLAIEDGTREIRMLYQGKVLESYDAFMDSEHRSFGPPCEGCELRSRCGGVYVEYAERRGWAEFGRPAVQVRA
jgi:MoaA/NifB/PqqE/SkfB family radical SAM enzyme